MSLFRFLQKDKSCRFLVDPTGLAAKKYSYFKQLLSHNNETLDIIATLEETYFGGGVFGMGAVRAACARLCAATGELIAAFNALAGDRHQGLSTALARLESAIAASLTPEAPSMAEPWVLPLSGAGPRIAGVTDAYFAEADAAWPQTPGSGLAAVVPSGARQAAARLVGGKAANLAEVCNVVGLPTPDGFVVTSRAFAVFLNSIELNKAIGRELDFVSPYDLPDLEERCARIRSAILAAPLPEELARQMEAAFRELEERHGGPLRVAMRSSAVGEDGRGSFAGQYATVLNVAESGLAMAYKTVAASKYAPGAILYRLRYGLDEGDTPMCVLGLAMVESAASGVLYTVDPSDPSRTSMRVDSVWGLGELLVGGEVRADSARIIRDLLDVIDVQVAAKAQRLVNLPEGGTRLEDVPEALRSQPSVTGATMLELARYGLALEKYFKAPQDVEWAVDPTGKLFILQSRPLDVDGLMAGEADAASVGDVPGDRAAASGMSAPGTPAPARLDPGTLEPVLAGRDAPIPGDALREVPAHRVLLQGGRTAARGVAIGEVLPVGGALPATVAGGAILVARSAAPEMAALLDRAGGVVTEMGGAASHLASVARELGIPALFGLPGCVDVLAGGMTVTLDATHGRVFEGRVEALLDAQAALSGASGASGPRLHVMESPMHRRLRVALDSIAPLHLTDISDIFAIPEDLWTIHDIIRFVHEMSMREMFGLSDAAGEHGVVAARLKAKIPLTLYCVDLGGGLRENLTTCDGLTPEDIRSLPLRAVWKGFTHPGISWSGTVAFSAGNLMTLLASPATAEVGGGTPGGDSYALVGAEYLNLSAKFGYHFANIDTYCSESPNQNFVTLRFAGGAGNYSGKCLRVVFLAKVLSRLGFTVTATGDVLDASLKGFDLPAMEAVLDQLGRLLASSRLLDMAIAGQGAAEAMAEAFFAGDYNFLENRATPLPGFHMSVGDWQAVEEEGVRVARQDGTSWATGVSRGFASLMGKLSGKRYQRFLDTVEAYFYFPLAIAKDFEMGDGRARVMVRPVSGHIDQAGGLAFGIRTMGDYLVLRVNALEDNVILFAFKDGQRRELASASLPVASGAWTEIAVEIRQNVATGFVDGKPRIIHHFDAPVRGHIGLWSKADSVTDFKGLSAATDEGERVITL